MYRRWFLFFFALLVLVAGSRKAPAQFITEVRPLPVSRGFHGAAVLGDFIYVLGGSVLTPEHEQVPAVTSHVAKIAPNGMLSNFAATEKLDDPRHYIHASTIVYNDTVYVFGGSTAPLDGACVNTVAWTRPRVNGMLEPWRISQPFSDQGVQCMAGFATPGYLHITGGLLDDETVTDAVWSVPINSDGSLGTWENAPRLPAPLWYHGAQVVGARAYVWGGLHTDDAADRKPSAKIYSSQILSTGQLSPWREEPVQLPAGMYSGVSAVAGPYLFSFCPRFGGGVGSNDIYWTYVTPQGMMPWQRQQTNIENWIYNAAAIDYRRGLIYITGGKRDYGHDIDPRNYMLRLSPKARELAEQSWVQNQGISQTWQDDQVADADGNRLSFEERGASDAVSRFHDLGTARGESQRLRKPLVMYFYMETAEPCRQQNDYLNKQNLDGFERAASLAQVDVRAFPQIAQQYGVFRVPTWLLFDAEGQEKGRLVGAQTLEQIAQAMK